MLTLSKIASRSLPPEGRGAVRALSRIGYELPEALADIIDNSIDAGARHVEVAFYRDNSVLTAVTIADDGCGMDYDALCRGMQFAGRLDHAPQELGAYGTGLKSASFSQCRTLSVISRRNGQTVGGRWSVESIDNDWNCDILDPNQCNVAFDKLCFRSGAPASGTLVLWERLERLAVGEEGHDLDRFLQAIMARLDAHLGLTFHRFLQSGALTISLIVRHEQRSLAMPRKVRALDPFGYAQSGVDGFPKILRTNLPNVGDLSLVCHIWPDGAASDNFLLGGKRGSEFQGFYFYRNDRLIQGGDWNGVVRNDPDPELALARVSVELPATGLNVDVKKSSLQVSAAQAQAFLQASDGTLNFEGYLDAARHYLRAVRKRDVETSRTISVPGEGVPARVRRLAAQKLAGDKPTEEINFAWEPLDEELVFQLDLTQSRVVLNRLHRQAILGADPASGADAPIVKMLLFLLLQNDFERTRTSPKRREEIRQINALLLEVVKGRQP